MLIVHHPISRKKLHHHSLTEHKPFKIYSRTWCWSKGTFGSIINSCIQMYKLLVSCQENMFLFVFLLHLRGKKHLSNLSVRETWGRVASHPLYTVSSWHLVLVRLNSVQLISWKPALMSFLNFLVHLCWTQAICSEFPALNSNTNPD